MPFSFVCYCRQFTRPRHCWNYIFLLAAEAAEAAAEAADAAVDAADAAVDAAGAAAAAPDLVTGACCLFPLAIPVAESRGAATTLAAELAAALAAAAGAAVFVDAALLAAAASTFAAGAGVCAMAVPIVMVATATVIMNLFIEFFILLPILKFECAVEITTCVPNEVDCNAVDRYQKKLTQVSLTLFLSSRDKKMESQ